jgi:hypothetical protein
MGTLVVGHSLAFQLLIKKLLGEEVELEPAQYFEFSVAELSDLFSKVTISK